ncbi:hypothetical protein BDV23DRAFT_177977 [Aspergillus alliaceus]|uniref:Uncharacterized protein n=1 Tax=Petromyces alliaceus TaxID=209559 RepID=A0A5N7CQE7_PETAA|nr:hypothetical protein BDV23DRAFT_177977 [Aspergillus alliaceus]
MKLSVLSIISLYLTGTAVARPTATTCTVQNSKINESHLLAREGGRKCGNRRYPYKYLNQGDDGPEVEFSGLCVESGANLFEWPILRNGELFGDEGRKVKGDDRVIVATYKPPNDAPEVSTYCGMITHEGASRQGGFIKCQ